MRGHSINLRAVGNIKQMVYVSHVMLYMVEVQPTSTQSLLLPALHRTLCGALLIRDFSKCKFHSVSLTESFPGNTQTQLALCRD